MQVPQFSGFPPILCRQDFPPNFIFASVQIPSPLCNTFQVCNSQLNMGGEAATQAVERGLTNIPVSVQHLLLLPLLSWLATRGKFLSWRTFLGRKEVGTVARSHCGHLLGCSLQRTANQQPQRATNQDLNVSACRVHPVCGAGA